MESSSSIEMQRRALKTLFYFIESVFTYIITYNHVNIYVGKVDFKLLSSQANFVSKEKNQIKKDLKSSHIHGSTQPVLLSSHEKKRLATVLFILHKS